MATPKQTDPQFKLRLPQALKDQIDQAAAASNRSLNAEIVQRLEQSLNNSDQAARIDRLELENRHLAALHRSEQRTRKASDKLNYHASALLFLFSDVFRRHLDGDQEALESFLEMARNDPDVLNFKMPDPAELEDES